MADELLSLAGQGIIRILDLLVIHKDEDGNFEADEIEDMENLDELRGLEREVAEVLAADDVAHLAAAMENGSTAGIVVWENTWAAPFASAARRAGGQTGRQRPDTDPGDHRLARGRRSRRDRRKRVTCLCEQHEQHVAVWSGRRSRVPPPSSGARRSPRTGSVVAATGAKTDATIEATGETTGAIVASRQAIAAPRRRPRPKTGG